MVDLEDVDHLRQSHLGASQIFDFAELQSGWIPHVAAQVNVLQFVCFVEESVQKHLLLVGSVYDVCVAKLVLKSMDLRLCCSNFLSYGAA